MTCVDYINGVRLSQAANHLLVTSSSIIDVALGVGYNNVSYFNRQFKSVYNVTPKEYRRIGREQSKALGNPEPDRSADSDTDSDTDAQ